MRIWRGSDEDSQNFQGGTVTVGKFDGLHLGHQKLLEEVRKGSKPWVVMTFDPLPLQFLQPDKGYHRLMPKEDLEHQLPAFGIDVLRILPFVRQLAEKTPEQFAEDYFWRDFKPKKIVVGHDFAMGKDRKGHVQWLKRWSDERDVQLLVVPPFELDGKVVSSGRVRELINQGAVDEAAKLLGRPFYVRGQVVQGAGRGRGIGVPTLNQKVVNETLPAIGVYASRTRWKNQVMNSVTNVGRVPTFTDQRNIQVETHVLNRDINAYGDTVDVDLIHRLRPEKKFASVEDLKKQIQQDILEASSILGGK